MQEPKVSVMIITYNHGQFLAQSIKSVLEQKTNFPFVINIIEDCSTDNTQDIARQFKQDFPDKINLFLNKKNIGSKVTQKNFTRGFKTLKGQYIAILEGDDYWNDENKLQKQVDFLDANPSFSACSHNTIKFYQDQKIRNHKFLYHGKKDIHTIEDVIYLHSMMHTSSLIYRNVFNGIPPTQFINPYSCDIFILIAHAQFGPIKYFDDDMAMYRSHSGGMFSGMSPLQGWMFNINGLRRYNRWLQFRYMKHFSYSIYKYCSYALDQRTHQGIKIPFFTTLKLKFLKAIYAIPSYFYYFTDPLNSPLGSKFVQKFYYDSGAEKRPHKSFLSLIEYEDLEV